MPSILTCLTSPRLATLYPLVTFIDEGQCAQYLDLPNLPSLGHPVPNLAHVQGVVITLASRVVISVAGVLPGLGQCPVVPDIAVVGETVADESEFFLLDVLLDGVERLRDTDLGNGSWDMLRWSTVLAYSTYLLLGALQIQVPFTYKHWYSHFTQTLGTPSYTNTANTSTPVP